MPITNTDLMLEIGSEAYKDLTTDEINAIIGRYDISQIRLAGMKAFELLTKKFKPTYRMGKTYKALSDKYQAYRKVYEWYCNVVGAGRNTGPETTTIRPLSRYKWRE